jgi:hypothetical protein
LTMGSRPATSDVNAGRCAHLFKHHHFGTEVASNGVLLCVHWLRCVRCLQWRKVDG